MNEQQWPIAQLGPIERLHVLAAGLPTAAVDERSLPADFDRVWTYFSDMERSLPAFDQAVAEFRIQRRTGSRLVARARSPRLRLTVTFDVDLEPGWCWMTARPRVYVVGFAAQAEGATTRFAHLEAFSVPGPQWVRAGAHAIMTKLAPRGHHVRSDVDRLEEALGLRP